ncbi:hypothetical protein D9M72_442620 [compost metagenome]
MFDPVTSWAKQGKVFGGGASYTFRDWILVVYVKEATARKIFKRRVDGWIERAPIAPDRFRLLTGEPKFLSDPCRSALDLDLALLALAFERTP